MSAVELRNFKSQLDLLTDSEQLAIIEYLVKALQKQQEKSDAVEKKSNAWVSETFALMDANPVYSNGVKWSREELYER